MKQKTLDFLEAHKSEQPSTFTEDAKWRQENEVWLKQKENSEFRAWRRQWRKVCPGDGCLSKGERYWFDQQETAELIAHNRKYQLLSPAEQYFRLCFEVCQDPSEGEYMSAADIFQRIKQVAGSSLGISAVTKFGQFLTNLDGIVHKRTNLGTVYLVKQKH